MPALIALALASAVALYRSEMGGPILTPVIAVLPAPFARAIAAHLAVLRIGHELLPAAGGAAVLLASWLETHRLLRVVSGWFELLTAVTAAPRNHPFRVKPSGPPPYSCGK